MLYANILCHFSTLVDSSAVATIQSAVRFLFKARKACRLAATKREIGGWFDTYMVC